jgi:DNA-binding transcriptional LysR family regulator
MELRHLRYFVAVAEELSFTGAAAKLRIAQPSLTRQIKNLEAELRVLLFSRDQRRIALTAQGEFFFERTKQLLAQSAVDVRDVRLRGQSSGGGSLNIGYAADLHYNLLPGALGALRKIWPEVALNLFDLSVAEQIKAFEKDKLDLSFVREVKLPAKSRLQRVPIHDCSVMAVLPVSDPRAQEGFIKLADLKPMPFVVLSEELYPGAQTWLKGVCRSAGYTPKIAHSVDRAPMLLSSVALELGVALMPQACEKLPHEGVVFRPLAEPVKSRTELVWKRKSLSQPLQEYARMVRQRFD